MVLTDKDCTSDVKIKYTSVERRRKRWDESGDVLSIQILEPLATTPPYLAGATQSGQSRRSRLYPPSITGLCLIRPSDLLVDTYSTKALKYASEYFQLQTNDYLDYFAARHFG